MEKGVFLFKIIQTKHLLRQSCIGLILPCERWMGRITSRAPSISVPCSDAFFFSAFHTSNENHPPLGMKMKLKISVGFGLCSWAAISCACCVCLNWNEVGGLQFPISWPGSDAHPSSELPRSTRLWINNCQMWKFKRFEFCPPFQLDLQLWMWPHSNSSFYFAFATNINWSICFEMMRLILTVDFGDCAE